MAAISTVAYPGLVMHEMVRRKNFASKNPGVILVFCIVFVVFAGVLGLCLSKVIKRRREAKPEL